MNPQKQAYAFPRSLLNVLCCPRCHADLELRENIFSCLGCGERYYAEGGVISFVASSDDQYVEEEAELFEEMKRSRDAFSTGQWEESKQAFISGVKKRVSDFGGMTVLHVGCGVDRFAGEFDDSMAYFSADITREMLMDIDNGEAANKFLVNCSVEALPFKDESFDMVLCIDLIHHFYSRGIEIPLREIARCMKRGGHFFLEEVNKYALYRLPYCFLPLGALNLLRKMKNWLRKGRAAPAPYEAPLSLFKVRSTLKRLFRELQKGEFVCEVIPSEEYPSVSEVGWRAYTRMGNVFPLVYKYLGFHWFIATNVK